MDVEELARTHGVALLRLAVMLAGTRSDAEDLLQSTFVDLIRYESKLQAARAPLAYARRAVINAFLSERRRPRREMPVAAVPDLATPETALPAGPGDGWSVLMALPHRQRAVLALRYYEGLTDAEIADVLGVAPSTVRSNATRALAALRRLPADVIEEIRP